MRQQNPFTEPIAESIVSTLSSDSRAFSSSISLSEVGIKGKEERIRLLVLLVIFLYIFLKISKDVFEVTKI